MNRDYAQVNNICGEDQSMEDCEDPYSRTNSFSPTRSRSPQPIQSPTSESGQYKLNQAHKLLMKKQQLVKERQEIDLYLTRLRTCLQELQKELALDMETRICHTCLWKHDTITQIYDNSGHYCDECLSDRHENTQMYISKIQ